LSSKRKKVSHEIDIEKSEQYVYILKKKKFAKILILLLIYPRKREMARLNEYENQFKHFIRGIITCSRAATIQTTGKHF
jgi:hypothetical protein